ncbi:hypothetical protein [Pseudoalteromonas sp. C12FD-1]|uniref:hypothetical protein n=1 Tax=Pseudoalteromonas sp. C12FD-1 TaxID=3131979 RepID=UPI00307EC4EF
MSFKIFLNSYLDTNFPKKGVSYSNYQKLKNSGTSVQNIDDYTFENELEAFREYFLHIIPKVLIPSAVELIKSGKCDFGHVSMIIHCNSPKALRFDDDSLNDASVAWLRKALKYFRSSLLSGHKDSLERFMSLNVQGKLLTSKISLLSYESIYWAYGIGLFLTKYNELSDILEVVGQALEQLYPDIKLSDKEKKNALRGWEQVLSGFNSHNSKYLPYTQQLTDEDISNSLEFKSEQDALYALLGEHFRYLWISFNTSFKMGAKGNTYKESSAQTNIKELAVDNLTEDEVNDVWKSNVSDAVQMSNDLVIERNENKQEEFEVLCQFLSDTYISEQQSTEELWVDLNKKNFSRFVLGYYSVTAISMYNGIQFNKNSKGIKANLKQKHREKERTEYLNLMCGSMRFKLSDDPVWLDYLSIVKKRKDKTDIFGDPETKSRKKLKCLINVFIKEAAKNHKLNRSTKRENCKNQYRELINFIGNSKHESLLLENSPSNEGELVNESARKNTILPNYDSVELMAVNRDSKFNKVIKETLDECFKASLRLSRMGKSPDQEFKKIQESCSRLLCLSENIQKYDEYLNDNNNTQFTVDVDLLQHRVYNFLTKIYSDKKDTNKQKLPSTFSVQEWKELNEELCSSPLSFKNKNFPEKNEPYIFEMYRKVWQAIESSQLTKKLTKDSFQRMFETLESNVKYDKRLTKIGNEPSKLDSKEITIEDDNNE